MNKLFTEDADGKLLICVLEPGNIHKLVAERLPIRIPLNEGPYEKGLPAKLNVLIYFSETPVADARELGKVAKVQIDTRSPKVNSSRPHCPECHSTIEQLGVWRSETPVWLIFCTMCGCVLGSTPRAAELEKKL